MKKNRKNTLENWTKTENKEGKWCVCVGGYEKGRQGKKRRNSNQRGKYI